jgi:poly(3-hydroxybutyrate) depolymerase
LCSGISKANKEGFEVKGAGHYGIFSGRRWREIVYPKISEFIRKHAPTPVAPALKQTSATRVATKKVVTPKALTATQAKPTPAKKPVTRAKKTVSATRARPKV